MRILKNPLTISDNVCGDSVGDGGLLRNTYEYSKHKSLHMLLVVVRLFTAGGKIFISIDHRIVYVSYWHHSATRRIVFKDFGAKVHWSKAFRYATLKCRKREGGGGDI